MARLKGPSASLVRATLRRIGPDLTRRPGVTHVTVGEKFTRGGRTGCRAIKVYVCAKTSDAPMQIPTTVAIFNQLGRKVGAVPTDVVEVKAEPQLFGLRSGHTVISFDRERGVAGLCFSKGGRSFVLTNAHVACDVRSGICGTLAWRLQGQETSLGAVVYASEIDALRVAREDMAVVRLGQDIISEDFRLDLVDAEVTRLDDLRHSAREHWFVANGQLFRCANPEPVDSPTDVAVDGAVFSYAGFWQLDAVVGDPEPGLSGALLCRTVGDHVVACGLVFAGIPGQFIWAFPFRTPFERVFAQL